MVLRTVHIKGQRPEAGLLLDRHETLPTVHRETTPCLGETPRYRDMAVSHRLLAISYFMGVNVYI